MNEEIFKLEELLKESEIPYYFNYREENRPAPFGAVPVELKNEELCITVGPVMENGAEAFIIKPFGEGVLEIKETIYMDEKNLTATVRHTNMAATAAFQVIRRGFLKHRAEWWPAVYGICRK